MRAPDTRRYLATKTAAPVMRHRLGDIAIDTINYGEPQTIGDAIVSFHPAGHVPGSAQIRVEVGGEVWVASGDYKTENDGLSEPFEPVRCHSFITESTFGLPVFRWDTQAQVAQELNDWWAACAAQGETALLGAYALGKAQRLMRMLNPDIGPILTHGAVEATNAVLRAQGIDLPATAPVTSDTKIKDHPAHCAGPAFGLGQRMGAQTGAARDRFCQRLDAAARHPAPPRGRSGLCRLRSRRLGGIEQRDTGHRCRKYLCHTWLHRYLHAAPE